MKTLAIVLSIALILGANLAFAESSAPPSTFVLSNHQILYNAAVEAHIDPQELLAVAKCESNMNPLATNGISFGILQFIPSTWAHYSKLLKIQNPDIWNVGQQAKVAAFLFSTDQEKQWSCFTIIHGKMK